jgi:hypothetical protein
MGTDRRNGSDGTCRQRNPGRASACVVHGQRRGMAGASSTVRAMRHGTHRPVYASAIRLLSSSQRWRHSSDVRELVAQLYGATSSQVLADAPLCDGCDGCDPRQREIPFT